MINIEKTYDWNLRLSKKVDIWIVSIFWIVTVFDVIACFFVYSIFPAEVAYYSDSGSIEGSIRKTIVIALTYAPIALAMTLILLGDRYKAKKESKLQDTDLKIEEPSFNFTKRNQIRLILIGILSFLSLPWIFAIVGIFMKDVPVLNLIFSTIHVGTHHGWDAYLLAVFAILLSITLDSEYYLKNPFARSLVAGTICFFTLFAIEVGSEDWINEQLRSKGIEVLIFPFIQWFYWSSLFYPVFGIITLLFVLYWYKYHENNK